MKHIRNDRHFTMRGNRGSMSVDQERVEAVTHGSRSCQGRVGERKRERPGAGRNGENPWDLLAAHAGSVWENLRVNRHSLVTCSSCCLWENALSSPGQLCCVGVLWWLGNNCMLCAPVLCAVCCPMVGTRLCFQ